MSTKENNNQQTSLRPGGAGGPGPGGHGPGRRFEKPKNFKKSISKLIKYIKPYRVQIIIAAIFTIAGTVATLNGPKMLGDITTIIFDNIKNRQEIDMKAISKIGLTLSVLYVLGYVFQVIQTFIMTKIIETLSRRLRNDIINKINALPLKYFDSRSYGEVLSRVTNDVDTVSQQLNQSVITAASSITSIITILIIMLTISPILTLIAVVTVPVSFILMTIVMKSSQKYFRANQKSLGEINGHIEEVYSGHNVIKVFNGSREFKKDFKRINDEFAQSAWKSQFYSGFMRPIMMAVGNIGYIAVAIVGSILVTAGKLGLGAIQSFIMYIRRFTQPMINVAQIATNLQTMAAAAERVFEFLDEEELSDESHKTTILKDVNGDVIFKNVKFGYNSDRLVIKGFNAEIKSGQKIAIVGPTGAGKTTLVNLLMRFYEINEGEILVDGVSIHDITRENTHELFGMVLQDTWLFNGTILENLTYGRKDITFEEVKKACQIANVDHFIESQPNGYNMMLGEESNISQGQKQLLTIARAIIENKPILILDEATSSVDTRTEILIQEAMDRLMKGRTSFVIAHRLSTIKNADLIFVINNGDIIEMGNHETLLAKGGFYKDLYYSQFEAVNE